MIDINSARHIIYNLQ